MNTIITLHNITAHPFLEEDKFDEQLSIYKSELYSLLSQDYSCIALLHSFGILTITHSTKNNGWQVTYFTKDMIANCDVQCESIEEIIKEIEMYKLQVLEIIE